MTHTAQTISSTIDRLGRKDLTHVETLPQGRGFVAHFTSDKGLRCYGQMSLVKGNNSYGLVIAPDGRIPRDAEARNILMPHL